MKKKTILSTSDGKEFINSQNAEFYEKKLALKEILLAKWEIAKDFEEFSDNVINDGRVFQQIYQAMRKIDQS